MPDNDEEHAKVVQDTSDGDEVIAGIDPDVSQLVEPPTEAG